MGSITFNQLAGGLIGSLLVFMLLGFFSEQIFGGPGGHEGERTLAFALDTGEDEESGAEQEEAEPEVSLAALVADADIEAGATVYNQCKACHKIEDGANAVGPHLWNVVGREIAGLDSFSYSDALKAKEGKWDLETLSAWLENPSEWAPGTTMGYGGLSDPADRVNVVAYINAQGDDPADLAAMAPEAPAESAGADEAPEDEPTETAAAGDAAEGDMADDAGDSDASGGGYEDLLAKASAENGKKVFNQCRACHKVEDGVNGVGPHLYGVVGREIASVEGYSYSDALASKEGKWTLDKLMTWLEDPNKFASGNKMQMGYPDAQNRIDVITYINQESGSPVELGAVTGEEDGAAAGSEGSGATGESGTSGDSHASGDSGTSEDSDAASEGDRAATDGAAGQETASGDTEEMQTAAAGDAGGSGPYADLLAKADAEAGKKVFNQCRACHKVEDGVNGVGPHLHDVVGREIAGVEGYSYSDALASKEGKWTLDNLMKWLENPNKFASGNKMMMNYPDPQDRINVITYLNEADGSPEPLQ